MIPKVIHYCWFGGAKYPAVVKKCLNSWKKYCPDYQIKRWDESNYDISKNLYVQQAYQAKKWAFVTDFARLDIVYQEGGIYLDTDVELLRSLDPLLSLEGFVAADEYGINTGVGFGAIKHHPTIQKMLDLYKGKLFVTAGGLDLTPCTQLNTKIFKDQGYVPGKSQITEIDKITIFPSQYFSPIQGATSQLHITPNTYAIHYSSLSWQTGITRLKAQIRMKLGLKIVSKLKRMFKGK